MSSKFKLVLFWLGVIVSAFVIKTVVFRGGSYVGIPKAPALSGAISQSLASSGTKTIPRLNKDYLINSVKYFQPQSWAVASISLSKLPQNNAIVILHQVDGAYRIVLGTGTAFSTYDTYSLPVDVILYLKNSGVLIYQPTGGQ